MANGIKRLLTQWLLTLLFAVGLTLPLMKAAGILSAWTVAVPAAAILSGWLSLGGMNRKCTIAVGAVTGLAAIVSLLAGGGAVVIEVMRGLVLEVTGTTAVLPLMAERTALVVTVFLTLLASLAARRDAGGIPGVALTGLMLIGLWVMNRGDAILLAAPALAASLTQLGITRNEKQQALPLIPWMLALAVICCLVVPSGGVTIAPLKENADHLRNKLYDYFFFTESRNIFSLADEGYYPQGANQLGGPASPLEHTVMAVQTPTRVYLRCVTRDTYTGNTWKSTLGSNRYLWVDPTRTSRRNTVFSANLPLTGDGATQEITITMLASGTSTLHTPCRMRSVNVTGDMVLYFNDTGEVFITRDLATGDMWTADAVPENAESVGVAVRVANCADLQDPAYAEIVNTYMALPGHLQTEVYSIAHAAAGDAQTPYEKALNIMNWLRTNCTYTLDASVVPPNVDFVTDFLINTREGYCTYFASAMTVLCRMEGIPARYVEGYLADPVNGTAILTGKDGHAWTEVYLNGYGWLIFDATPQDAVGNSGTGTDGNAPEDNQSPEMQLESIPTPPPDDDPEPEGEPEDTPEPDDPDEPEDEPDEPDSEDPEPEEEPGTTAAPRSASWLLWLLLAAAAACTVWRLIATDPRRQARRAQDHATAYAVWRNAVMQSLRILKQKRGADESVMTWFKRLADEGLPQQLAEAGAAETLAAYSKYGADESWVTAMRRGYDALYATLTRGQRIRLILLRMVSCKSSKRKAKTA